MQNPVKWFRTLPTERQLAFAIAALAVAYVFGIRP